MMSMITLSHVSLTIYIVVMLLTSALLRTITETEAHAIWIDNFCKLYHTRMIELEKHTLQSLLWTGVVAKRVARPSEVSDAVML